MVWLCTVTLHAWRVSAEPRCRPPLRSLSASPSALPRSTCVLPPCRRCVYLCGRRRAVGLFFFASGKKKKKRNEPTNDAAQAAAAAVTKR